VSFETFNFDETLLKAIEQAKFTRASKIQKLVIPEVLAGHDVIASAHSGSGKSASFVLPLIQILLNNKAFSPSADSFDIQDQNDEFIDEENHFEKNNEDNFLEGNADGNGNENGDEENSDLLHNAFEHNALENNQHEIFDSENLEPSVKPKNGPKVLILAPTRELANQISACIRRFTKDLGLRYGILVGGAPYPPQVRMLKKPVDFLVATPGRLLDHLKNNRVNFDKIEFLVIDEINRMIDMKMHADLLEIYSYIPKSQTLENGDIKLRQTLLFAGSLEGDSLENISKEFQNNPVRFELARSKHSYRNLHQSMYIADEGEHKLQLCNALVRQAFLDDSAINNIIIYSTQRENLDNLSAFLLNLFPEFVKENENLLNGPSNKRILLLVDEQNINESLLSIEMENLKIIHLDLPDDILVFLQRLEPAIDQESAQELCLLIGKNEWPMLHQIERYIGKTLSRKKIEGLEPVSTEPSVSSQISSGKFTNQTKNRNPYSGRRQNKSTSQKSNPRNRNQNQHFVASSQVEASELYFENMDSNDIYNEQLKGNVIDTGNKAPLRKKGQRTTNTKNHSQTPRANSPRSDSPRSNSLRSNSPQSNGAQNNGARINKTAKPSNKGRKKQKQQNPQQNFNNPQLAGNSFTAVTAVDDRDLSWKQYITNISNGNAPSKTANKKFRSKHGSQKGGFDLNHSPMAISAKKVRDIAKNEEWASEKKEAAKPSVQIRVKAPVKIKGTLDIINNDTQKSYSDFDAERIDGKLGINK